MDYQLMVIVITALFLGPHVIADGYSKETPVGTVSLEGSNAGGESPQPFPQTTLAGMEVAASPSPLPHVYHRDLQPALASGLYSGLYSRLYSGLDPGLYAAGYPPVSTDYVSRYYGPTAIPVVLPDGHIADTPAVAAARTAHLAALNRAKALWYGPRDDGSYDPYKYGDYAYNYLNDGYYTGQGYRQGPLNQPYNGPLATPTVLPSGYLADTPAIAAARASHLSALARARADAALWRSQYLRG